MAIKVFGSVGVTDENGVCDRRSWGRGLGECPVRDASHRQNGQQATQMTHGGTPGEETGHKEPASRDRCGVQGAALLLVARATRRARNARPSS